jgi:hypothetical protein
VVLVLLLSDCVVALISAANFINEMENGPSDGF